MKNTNKQYVSFLNQQKWSFFCTFTTAYTMSIKSSRRLMDRFFSSLKRKIPKEEPRLFWVAEPNNIRVGYHLHGLLYLPEFYNNPKNYKSVIYTYQNACGGEEKENHRIELNRYKKGRNASEYCLKLIDLLNDNNNKIDYDIYI